MPVVTVDLIEGYDAATKARLGKALTHAVLGVVAAPTDAVTVMLNDHPPEGCMRGGQHRQPGAPRPDPIRIVRDFLAALEARDLDTARRALAPGFTMTLPGDARMTTLDELIAWSKPRYARVGKTYGRFDACQDGATAIVYCFGTLHGDWLDGTAFDGIRFIDRFEIEDARLTRQDVWNDMSEARA